MQDYPSVRVIIYWHGILAGIWYHLRVAPHRDEVTLIVLKKNGVPDNKELLRELSKL